MPDSEIRKGAVTMKGNPLDLVGPQLKAGDPAPDFTCVGAGMSVIKLSDTAGKPRLFNVVPSLDTPVCNLQSRHFSQVITELGDKVAAYTVSLDLPFAQARWCKDANVENIKNLSDVHDQSFGKHYGLLIQGLPIALLARAVIVVGADNTIKYIEVVREIASEPNYGPALEALKTAAGV